LTGVKVVIILYITSFMLLWYIFIIESS